MSTNTPILFAYEINMDGTGTALSGDDVSQRLKDEKLAWAHLDATHPDTKAWLERELSYLDALVIDALLAEETRPRMLEFEQGCMMILRGVNLNQDAHPEDMISMRIWVDKSRIISLQRRPLKAIQDMRDKLENGSGPKTSGGLVSSLAVRLFERMEPVFSDLYDSLDDLEERILEKPDASERRGITDIRKQAIIFRRFIAPQKDVMSQLRMAEFEWMEPLHKRRIHEAQDRLTRYVEDLDTIRERAQIVKDELANSLADKMNRNTYVLSVVAAVFLPLGFLTGLLGINVGGMPGVENDMAFWIVCALCAAFGLGVSIIFKMLKWL